MAKGRDGLRFPLESGKRLVVSGDRFGKNLDGHLPVELRILRSINFDHPPGAQGREDLVFKAPRRGLAADDSQ